MHIVYMYTYISNKDMCIARAGDLDAQHLMHDISITSVKAEHARGRNDVFKSCL